MATTTLLQRHAAEGETIAEAIRDCLDYGKNPEKTESGKYISAYECDPATVADEFLLAKASYAAMTGREQKKENNVLCYQIRQSFYPGEITPKEANRIGYELAMRWTKGRHAFIVTTHTDKQHIHCHIYYNSTTLDCTRKFRNFWGSSFALRRLSDRLCLENGLSIVENPKPRSKSKYRNYGEWQKDRKGPLSYQDRLRLAIDTALAERPADLDEFLNLMKGAGYEVKTVRGGGISFRLTGQGQERFTRLRASTLGDGYDLQDVLSAIEGKEKRSGRSGRKISLAVDIQAKLAAGKGPGYERWAKVFNIKQMAAALAYIQDNGLTDYEQLAQKATEAADRFHAISEQIKQTEQTMKTNAGLKAATVQYAKTRPVFEQYKETTKLPMKGKVGKGYRTYCALVLALTMAVSMAAPAYAAGDPLTVINNLSDFIFGLIRAVGMILLGFGIVQVGLSLKSHDPSQRANGFLTLAGGVIITFAKEILTLIVG